MSGTLKRRLTATDAAFLYLERPNSPLHIGSLAIYEGRIPFEPFKTQIRSRMPLIPRYRQRVAPVPFSLAHPTWEDDPDFDIGRHVFRVELPPPGTDEQLRELTTRLFAPPLDRNKPLWEIYVVYGLQGDRTAIVSKVHHCAVDGVSGIELLVATLDIAPEPAPPPPDDGWSPQPLPGPMQRLSEAFWDGLLEQIARAREVQQRLQHPQPTLRQWGEAMRAFRTALPWLAVPPPRTPFAVALGPERRVAFSDVSFVEIRQIRTSLGGTVNDVVLAILAGALRKYFLQRGMRVDNWEPRVAIPVNVRLEDEKGTLGNRISAMFATLPIGEPDPAARLHAVREQIETLKSEHQAGAAELLMRMAALTPVPIQAMAGLTVTNTLINFICTNVPGPMIPLYCRGHLLLDHYPLVPLSLDMGFGVGVTSYNHRLFFGLMADPKAVPDLDRMKEALDASFVELRAAAGVDVIGLPPLETVRTNGEAVGAGVAAEEAPA
jgi:WS/DGAT/MGAT family acyltransferase